MTPPGDEIDWRYYGIFYDEDFADPYARLYVGSTCYHQPDEIDGINLLIGAYYDRPAGRSGIFNSDDSEENVSAPGTGSLLLHCSV